MGWLIFCLIMIAFVSEALIREGFGKVFTAKVAGWLMFAAIVTGVAPNAFAELEAYRKVSGIGASDLNDSISASQSFSWKPVKTVRILPDQPQNSPHVATAESNEANSKIDFTTICGGGEKLNENRLDLAKMNEGLSDSRC